MRFLLFLSFGLFISISSFAQDESLADLIVKTKKDTINISDDWWSMSPEISYLNKKFLKFNYEVRGGSNLALGNTTIICVSENKLYEALHVLRYAHWDSGDLITYDIRMALVNYKQAYTLEANVREKVNSITDPETNYNYTNNTELQFDKNLKVFYSIKYDLYDTLKVSYPNLTYTREIQGNFPKVLLGKEEYIFIGGQWFQPYNGTLIKF